MKLSPMKALFIASLLPLSVANAATADKSGEEYADMSDPLAVFTQVGGGVTNKGLNLKIGQQYDTGDATTAAMNIIEVKGMMGEQLGWTGNSQRDDSIDSFRFRNFSVNLSPSVWAKQLDINYNVEGNLVASETADVSYSLIKAMPALGPFTYYPLAGLGASIGNDAIDDLDDLRSDGKGPAVDGGFSLMGAYGLVGMYTKLAITDKIWLNYNPFWLTTITGSENYEDNYYGKGDSHILTHEFAASYQITPRFNVRYFANWTENVDFKDGDHRIEFNYQI